MYKHVLGSPILKDMCSQASSPVLSPNTIPVYLLSFEGRLLKVQLSNRYGGAGAGCMCACVCMHVWILALFTVGSIIPVAVNMLTSYILDF